jgi:hypothetical protein
MQLMPPEMLGALVEKIGGSTFVVLNHTGSTVLQDPALRLPFHTKNKKFAEMVAKESSGTVVTFSEALRIITDKSKPND